MQAREVFQNKETPQGLGNEPRGVRLEATPQQTRQRLTLDTSRLTSDSNGNFRSSSFDHAAMVKGKSLPIPKMPTSSDPAASADSSASVTSTASEGTNPDARRPSGSALRRISSREFHRLRQAGRMLGGALPRAGGGGRDHLFTHLRSSFSAGTDTHGQVIPRTLLGRTPAPPAQQLRERKPKMLNASPGETRLPTSLLHSSTSSRRPPSASTYPWSACPWAMMLSLFDRATMDHDRRREAIQSAATRADAARARS